MFDIVLQNTKYKNAINQLFILISLIVANTTVVTKDFYR